MFASNPGDKRSHNLDLYVIDPQAADPEKNLVQVTHSPDFESLPMFSPDGRKLVFTSSRNATGHHDFNLFLADWVGR